MKGFFLYVLSIAYGSMGIFSVMGYWATIKDLFCFKKPSANITTYVMWTYTSGVGLLYSIFILPDFLFRLISAIGFICCFSILLLSLDLKYGLRAKFYNFSSFLSFSDLRRKLKFSIAKVRQIDNFKKIV